MNGAVLFVGDAMTLTDYGKFLFLREKDYDRGEEFLKKALAIDADYAPACFYLGMLLVDVKKQKV